MSGRTAGARMPAGFDRLLSCDWSLDAGKRVVAVAERREGGWACLPVRALGGAGAFLDLLSDPGARTLAGFDFPIGLPAAYARLAGIDEFPAALPGFGEGAWSEFYLPCERPEQIGVRRPFYPRAGHAGLTRASLVSGIGVERFEALLRAPERGEPGGRRAASSLFWTFGPAQVGKAAIHGWREVLVPAIRRGARLWPFEGALAGLAVAGRPVLAETYPAEAYAPLGCAFGPGRSKMRREDRAAMAPGLLARCAGLGIALAPELAAALADGFGERGGDDPFDALVALLLMIDVVEGRRAAGDAAPGARAVEGWILGRPAAAGTPGEAPAGMAVGTPAGAQAGAPVPLFPAFLDLAGRPVLLLGRGEAADRRLATLVAAGAVVRRADRFSPGLLDGAALAIGAEAGEAELAALFREARARGIPVNCVDRPLLSSFVTPAVVDRLPMQVAICGNGAAPVLSRLLRARIETVVDPAYGRLAALAARLKDETRRRLPDVLARRRMLERALGGRAGALMLAGDDAGAERAYRDALDAATVGAAAAEPGIVHLVETGDGTADLLPLRALRLMGEADVIVHGAAEGAAVLALARRDASRRVAGADGAAALLVALARDGAKVVRLGPRPGEAEALGAAAIAFRRVPCAAADG